MDNAFWTLRGNHHRREKGISASTFAGLSVFCSLKSQTYKTKQKKKKKNQFPTFFCGEDCLDRVQDAPFGCLCAFYGVQINLLWHPPLTASPTEFVVPLHWSYLRGSVEEHPSWEGGLTVSCTQQFTLQSVKAPPERRQPLPVLFLYFFPDHDATGKQSDFFPPVRPTSWLPTATVLHESGEDSLWEFFQPETLSPQFPRPLPGVSWSDYKRAIKPRSPAVAGENT